MPTHAAVPCAVALDSSRLGNKKPLLAQVIARRLRLARDSHVYASEAVECKQIQCFCLRACKKYNRNIRAVGGVRRAMFSPHFSDEDSDLSEFASVVWIAR